MNLYLPNTTANGKILFPQHESQQLVLRKSPDNMGSGWEVLLVATNPYGHEWLLRSHEFPVIKHAYYSILELSAKNLSDASHKLV